MNYEDVLNQSTYLLGLIICLDVRVFMANLVYLALNWIHVMAVVLYVGGAVFFDFILIPKLKAVPEKESAMLMQGVFKRFVTFVWINVIIIATTGLIRAGLMGGINPQILLATFWGNILLSKMLLTLVIIILGLAITKIGMGLMIASPPPSQGEAQSGPPPGVIKAQRRIKILSEINSGVGALIIFLSIYFAGS